MRNFSNRRPSSNRGGRNRYSSDRANRPEMFDAVCDECGKPCKVPFRPSGDKPIYCSRCFERRGNKTYGDSNVKGNTSINLDEVNRKLDRILSILETKDIVQE